MIVGLIAIAVLGVLTVLGVNLAQVFGRAEEDLAYATGARAGFTIEVGAASGLTVPLTVTLSRPPEQGGEASVRLASSDGSAIAPADYAALDTVLTFPEGTLSQTTTIVGQPRAAWGGPLRTLTVALSQPVNAGLAGASATVTLPDGIAAPIARFDDTADLALVEADPAQPVPVRLLLSEALAAPAEATLALRFAAPGPDAASAADLALTQTVVAIPAYATEAFAEIAALPDLDQELAESAVLELVQVVSNGRSLELADAQRSVVIAGNGEDPVAYLAALPEAPLVEPSETGFSVRLSHPTYRPVAVTLNLDPDSADSSDWALAEGATAPLQLDFSPGLTEAPVTLEIVADGAEEAAEQFGLRLSDPSAATLATDDPARPSTASLSIAANGTAPTVALSPATVALTEGGAGTELVLTLSNPSYRQIAVPLLFAGSGENAASLADIAVAAAAGTTLASDAGGWTVTFAPQATEARLTVTASDDSLFEGAATEGFTLTVDGSAIGTTAGGAAVVAGTVTDNDSAPVLTLEALDSSASTVAEGGGTASFRIAIAPPSARAIALSFTLGGTAVLGEDFTASSASPLTVPAGAASATLDITAIADDIDEDDETVVLTLTGADGGATLDGAASATVTLQDDTPAAVATLSGPSPASADEGSGTPLVFTVALSRVSSRSVSVAGTLSPDAATAGYTLSGALPLVFAAGETQKTLSLTPVADGIASPDRSVTFTLTGADNGAELGTSVSGTATIRNTDAAPTVAFDSATPSGALAEAGGTRSFTVRLSTVTVPFTLTGTAGSGDYTVTASPLSFAPGTTSSTVTVTAVQDTGFEGDETAILTLGTPTGATLSATPADLTRTATITDDDAQPVLGFTGPADGTVAEAGGALSFTVALSNASSSAISLPFTLSGTAVQGSDYSVTASPLAIAAGATSATITVTGVNDSLFEGDETVIVTLGTPTGATLTATVADRSRTAVIVSDDGAPTVAFSATTPNATANESQSRSFTVALSAVSGVDTGVAFAVGGSASSSDYSVSPASPLSIPAGSTTATVTVNTSANGAYEASRTVTLTLTSATNAAVGADSGRTFTVANTDLPASCKQIKDVTGTNQSGAYTIAGNNSVYCDMTRQGGGWTLVRRTTPDTWWPLDDNWNCNTTHGSYVAQRGRSSTFGMSFCSLGASQVLITTGDDAKWMQTYLSQITGPYASNPACDGVVTLLGSHNGSLSYPLNVLACMRGQQQEDPWLTNDDHHGPRAGGGFTAVDGQNTEAHSMLWGEGAAAGNGWSYWRANHNGIEAFVR